jgi:hypothetical protein
MNKKELAKGDIDIVSIQHGQTVIVKEQKYLLLHPDSK